MVIWLFSMSLFPNSILTGMPFTSASANLYPNDFSVSSMYDVMLALSSVWWIFSASSLVFSSVVALMMATCTGAIFGGRISPLSSPCTIIRAPIILFEVPQEVW